MAFRAGAVLVGCVMPLLIESRVEAAFVRLVVTSIDVDEDGKQLTVYTLAARFDSPSDAVIMAYQLGSEKPENFKGFWHRDLATAPNDEAAPVLTQDAGTWNPTLVGAIKTNRPVDSYLTVGGEANQRNSTIADPSWAKAGNDPRGWARPDLPATGKTGWYVAARGAESSGRAGNSKNYEINGKPTLENPATDVRLAQFVLSRGHAPREFTLTVSWNDGTEGKPQSYSTEKFTLGGDTKPAPPGANGAKP
jgi:hypothetical protein